MRAVERDPDKRYSSGRAMAEDLEEVLRETGFKARMMPKMLHDLFGTGLQSSQVVLSQLTPELLAAPSDGSNSEDVSLPSTGMTGRLLVNSWRLWGAIAATAAVAILATYSIVRSGKAHALAPTVPAVVEKRSAASTASVASQALSPQRPQASASSVPLLLLGPSAAQSADATKKAKRGAGSKRARAPGTAPNLIGGGHSIDPFKEATLRGMR